MLHINLSVGNSLACGDHQSTDWQVATDSNFDNVVADSINDSVNKEKISLEIPSNLVGVTVYARARVRGTELINNLLCISPWGYSTGLVYRDEEELTVFPMPELSFDLGTHLNGNGTYSTGWFVVLDNASDFFDLESHVPYVLLLTFDTIDGSEGYFASVSFFDINNDPFPEVAYFFNQMVYEGRDLILRAKVVLHTSIGSTVETGEVSFIFNSKPNILNYIQLATAPTVGGSNYTPVAGLIQGFAFSRMTGKFDLYSTPPTVYYKSDSGAVTPYPGLPAQPANVEVYNVRPLATLRNLSPGDDRINVILGTYNTSTGDRAIKYYYYTSSGSWAGGNDIVPDGQKLLDARLYGGDLLVVVTDDLNIAPTAEIEKTINVYYNVDTYVPDIILTTSIPVLTETAMETVPSTIVGFPPGITDVVSWGGKRDRIYVAGMNTSLFALPANPIFEINPLTGDYIRITDVPPNLSDFVGERLDYDSFYLIGTDTATGLPQAFIYTISKDLWEEYAIPYNGGNFNYAHCEITKTFDNKIILGGGTRTSPSGYNDNFIITEA